MFYFFHSRKSRVSGNLTLKFLYYNNPPPRASAGINNLGESALVHSTPSHAHHTQDSS